MYKSEDGSVKSTPDCVLEDINNFPPYPGNELYNKTLQPGLKAPQLLMGCSNFIGISEDAFKKDDRRRWLNRSQVLRINMLTQYVFGLMDIQAHDYIASKMNNSIIRNLFLFIWNIGLLIALLRWKFVFLALPVDFLSICKSANFLE